MTTLAEQLAREFPAARILIGAPDFEPSQALATLARSRDEGPGGGAVEYSPGGGFDYLQGGFEYYSSQCGFDHARAPFDAIQDFGASSFDFSCSGPDPLEAQMQRLRRLLDRSQHPTVTAIAFGSQGG